MASGCIMDECKNCNEFIWEDERWEFNDKNECYHIDLYHLTLLTVLEVTIEYHS